LPAAPDSLFRPEALGEATSGLPTAQRERWQRRGSGIWILVGLTAIALAATLFVRVSLGVSVTGLVRAADSAPPIVASRAGVLSYVVTDRRPVELKAGETVATIEGLDLATRSRGGDSAVSMEKLAEQREELETRRVEVTALSAAATKDLDALLEAIRFDTEQTELLLPTYRQEVERARERVLRDEQLQSDGLTNNAQVEGQQALLLNRETALADLEQRLRQSAARMLEIEIERAQLLNGYGEQLVAISTALADIDLALLAEERLAEASIVMPEDGILIPRGLVNGQVVESGNILFDVSRSDGSITFEADIPSSKIGGIEEGLPVKIALSAYPYLRDGYLSGRVVLVSTIPNQEIEFSETLTEVGQYRVVIEPDPADLERYRQGKVLLPGMDAQLHIRTDEVALGEVLLSPMLRTVSRLNVDVQ